MAKKHFIIAAILAALLFVWCLPDSYLLGESVIDMDSVENEPTGTKSTSPGSILGSFYIYQPMLVCTYWRFDNWQKRKVYYQYLGAWIGRENVPGHDLAKGRPCRSACPSPMGDE